MANIWIQASDGDIDAVKKFLAEGGDVNVKDEFGYTPLYVLPPASRRSQARLTCSQH
jgi:hypothetical protein